MLYAPSPAALLDDVNSSAVEMTLTIYTAHTASGKSRFHSLYLLD